MWFVFCPVFAFTYSLELSSLTRFFGERVGSTQVSCYRSGYQSLSTRLLITDCIEIWTKCWPDILLSHPMFLSYTASSFLCFESWIPKARQLWDSSRYLLALLTTTCVLYTWGLASHACNPSGSDPRRYVRDIPYVPCCCCSPHFSVYTCGSFVWPKLRRRSWCNRLGFWSRRSIAAIGEGRLRHLSVGG